ncbi:tyrosine-type recombinase/integrase [Haloquadratum walsbyi]|uniref:tyrosine-type recombinase/integrase n=1 Tax=Haloquadratum walsbyi TaxID=293091 RepID=UPI001E482CE5
MNIPRRNLLTKRILRKHITRLQTTQHLHTATQQHRPTQTQTNRYNKDSSSDIFRKIASEAGLDLENRDITPYSIRHSTATYLAEEEGLAVAAQQCRHKSQRTTEKYEHSSTTQQQDAVNNID